MSAFKLRHIDSGDERAWWLRQDETVDEDDTLAEETLNPLDDEQDVSAATEPQGEHSKTGWWSNSNNENEIEKENHMENHNENTSQRGQLNGNGFGPEINQDHEVKQMPRSRISPEHDAWWLEEDQQQSQDSKQNGYHEEPHVEVTLKVVLRTEGA